MGFVNAEYHRLETENLQNRQNKAHRDPECWVFLLNRRFPRMEGVDQSIFLSPNR